MEYVKGERSGSLQNDGTACFAKERTAFYAAVDEVTAAQRLELAAKVSIVGGLAVAAIADSRLAQLAALGFSGLMVALAVDLANDRTRAEKVSRSFDDLVRCRRGEARKINAELRSGEIDRESAERRMSSIRNLVMEDVAIAKEANSILVARTEAFAVTTEKAKAQAAPPATPQEAKENKREEKKVAAAIQTNQRVLAQQTASIAQAESLADDDGGFELALLILPVDIVDYEGAA